MPRDHDAPNRCDCAACYDPVGRAVRLHFWVAVGHVAALVLALAAVFLLAALLRAAPAPLPPRKPTPPPCLAGRWRLDYAGACYDATLAPGGRYEAVSPGGVRWSGSWEQEGRALKVRETLGGDCWVGWAVELDRDLSGRTEGGTEVRLRRE